MTERPGDSGSDDQPRRRHDVTAEEVDRRFADLVANFGPVSTPEPAPEAPEPEAEPAPDPLNEAPSTGEADPAPATEATAWRAAEHSDQADDDHFVPEPPPPLPAGDLSFWTIVGGLTIGPLLIILSLVLPILSNELWTWVGVSATIVGFITLIRRPPGGHGPDRGARV